MTLSIQVKQDRLPIVLQKNGVRVKALRVSLGSLKRFETTGQISLESLLLLADVLNRLDDFDAVLNCKP